MCLQVTSTHELRVYSNITPTQFAELMFNMMAAFPTNALDKLLTPEQLQQLRDTYMPEATSMAEGMVTEDGSIALHYTMLWARATATT